MSDKVNMHEFVAGFIMEADEHLHSVNQNLVTVSEAVKQNRLEPRGVRELFRSLHTIKGLASMVGADPIAEISHEMEGILRTADRAGGKLAENTLDLLLRGTRAVEERVKQISKFGISGLTKAPRQLIEQLVLIQESVQAAGRQSHAHELNLPAEIEKALSLSDREQANQAVAAKRGLFLIDFAPSPEKAAQGLTISSIRERLAKVGELIKVVPHSSTEAPTGIAFFLLFATDHKAAEVAEHAKVDVVLVQDIGANVTAAVGSDSILPPADFDTLNDFESQADAISSEHSSIRVDIKRLDESLERLSELIVTRSKLVKVAADLTERGVNTRELVAIIAENGRQLKRLRSAITKARMVPMAELLQRLPLVVRGLTKDSEKSVNLQMQTGSSEVDKAVADRIFPAIIHLIRNSVDHAIESTTERRNAGKDETGSVSVVCDDSSGASLSITITDDGRGIDRHAVAKKSGTAVARTDDELLDQICTPGLSTRDDVTRTSGRGMGMDIVKKTIENLGGHLTLATTAGRGSSFVIKVPVSITIIDVFSFVSGGQTFVAPVSMIDEIMEIEPAKLSKSPVVSGVGPEPRLLNRRGETIPYLVLDSVLHGHQDRSVPLRALVVNQHRGAVAFGVDRMIGQQEVVIRPLDEKIIRVPGMNGAADLGDGHPTLVLDLASIGASFSKTVEVSL